MFYYKFWFNCYSFCIELTLIFKVYVIFHCEFGNKRIVQSLIKVKALLVLHYYPYKPNIKLNYKAFKNLTKFYY